MIHLARWLLVAAAILPAACHTPSADITTVQDSKYPLNRGSKIGFLDEQQIPNLNARLATKLSEEQMRRLGFTIVPAAQADYVAHADEVPRDIAVVEGPTGPSFGTGIGGGSGGLFTGVGVGVPLGPTQADVIHRTELDVTVETTAEPKLTVWQGKILADTEDRTKYTSNFFRALLSRIGMTYNGTIRLNREDEVAPKP